MTKQELKQAREQINRECVKIGAPTLDELQEMAECCGAQKDLAELGDAIWHLVKSQKKGRAREKQIQRVNRAYAAFQAKLPFWSPEHRAFIVPESLEN